MKVENVKIRGKNNRKHEGRNMVLAIGASAAIVAGMVGISYAAKHPSFQKVDIDATTEEEVMEQVEDKYGYDLDNSKYKDIVVNYCVDSNQYAVNPSIQNRMDFVSSARSLASASENLLKEKLQDGDPEHERYQLRYPNPSAEPNRMVFADKENVYGLTDSYRLPEKSAELFINAESVLEYGGTGENKVWDNQIGAFSRTSNSLLDKFVDSLEYDLTIDKENDCVTLIPAQISQVKGR